MRRFTLIALFLFSDFCTAQQPISNMPHANLPVSGSELFTFVQSGYTSVTCPLYVSLTGLCNVQASFNDLFGTLTNVNIVNGNLGRPSFIDLTNAINAPSTSFPACGPFSVVSNNLGSSATPQCNNTLSIQTIIVPNGATISTTGTGTNTANALAAGTSLAATTGLDLTSAPGASILPIANGGNGTATPVISAGTNITVTGTWPNYTITASSTAATAFSAITSATNGNTLVMGAGGSLSASGGGTITATAMATTGLTGALQAAQMPALTGDVTNSAGSLTTAVGKVNGGTFPASAGFVGTNSSSQLIAVTGGTLTTGLTVNGGTVSLNNNSNNNVNACTGTSTGTCTFGQNSATPSSILIKGPLIFQGGTATSAASWNTNSPNWNIAAATLNDTTASGTVTTEAANTIQSPTFTSTGGASTTITNAATLWIDAPTCSGGLVCTNLYSLFLSGGLRSTVLTATGLITGTAGANISAGTITLNATANNINLANGASASGTVSILGGSGTPTGLVHINDSAGTGLNAIGAQTNDTNLGSANIKLNGSKWISNAVPTIGAGFGSTASFTPTFNSTKAFIITASGTGQSTATALTGFGTAPNNWICNAQDKTTAITGRQTTSTATAVTITWNVAPTASDVLLFQCDAL